ncbi:MAG: TonB-dependent receptor, partial [Rhodothermales bacterium]
TYAGGSRDWLAADDGTRSLPAAVADVNDGIPSAARARFDAEAAARLDEASKSFNSVMAPTTSSGPVNQSYSVSLGNRAPIGGGTLGFVLGATYSKSASLYDNGRTERWAYSGQNTGELGADLLMNDSRATQDVSIGLMANFAYQPAPNHKIALNTLHTRNGESEARYQAGQWYELDINDPTNKFLDRTLVWTQRRLYSAQLKGEDYLPGLARTQVGWGLSYGKATQDEPDHRFVASTERVVGDNTIRTMTSSNFQAPTRYFRNMNEETLDSNLDFSLPLPEGGSLSGKIKLGGAYQRTTRTFRERSIEMVTNPNVPFDGNVDAFFSPENMGILKIDTLSTGSLRYAFGNTLRDASKPRNQYDGSRDIAAGYSMADLLLGHKLRVIAGARLESTRMSVVSQDTLVDTGNIDKLDLLPSLNTIYHITNEMNLRLGVSKTLARPVFREIAPFESFDFLLGSFLIGNPALDRSLIWNYDLRWEWFIRPREIFATSLFYKNLQNPIERAIIGGSNGQTRFQNVPRAQVFGLEFEVRSSLDRVASLLRNFQIGLNLTFSQSTIDIPGVYDEHGNLVAGELFLRRQVDPDVSTRELQGQSPYLVNADVSYENYSSGTYAGLHFNVFGRRLSNISLGNTPDVYERAVPTLDFTFSQAVFENWKLKLSAMNLLDPNIKQTYGLGDKEFIYQNYTRGRTYSVGVSYSI